MSWNENFHAVKTIRGWIQSFLFHMAVGQGQMEILRNTSRCFGISGDREENNDEEETHAKNFSYLLQCTILCSAKNIIQLQFMKPSNAS